MKHYLIYRHFILCQILSCLVHVKALDNASSASPNITRGKKYTFFKFISFFSKNKNLLPSKTEDCLARCIRSMHSKHSMVFGGMVRRLSINRNIDFYQGFVEVSEELFVDNISWSKVVALYAFAARLGQFCIEHNMEDLLGSLTESLTRFSLEYLSSFLQSQGGWVSHFLLPLFSDIL